MGFQHSDQCSKPRFVGALAVRPRTGKKGVLRIGRNAGTPQNIPKTQQQRVLGVEIQLDSQRSSWIRGGLFLEAYGFGEYQKKKLGLEIELD